MRKYYVVDAEVYEQFVSNLTPVLTKKDAMEAADALAETAQDEGNPEARFAVFEEVGMHQAQIVRKVTRNFTSSRSIERKPKSEGAGTEEGNESSESTGEAKRKRGRKPKTEATE
jgi:hypothetical protein